MQWIPAFVGIEENEMVDTLDKEARQLNSNHCSARHPLSHRFSTWSIAPSCGHLRLSGGYDEAHFWLNGYVNKQNCRIWSEANPQVYVETPLHPEKLTVWCALWAGGILLQKR
ncbi:hypothetical protein TNCV_3668891 [Trichonephila clavipes]|nr:hypothetical protein TNCV_3668891 [Trichonephila clavipes]